MDAKEENKMTNENRIIIISEDYQLNYVCASKSDGFTSHVVKIN